MGGHFICVIMTSCVQKSISDSPLKQSKLVYSILNNDKSNNSNNSENNSNAYE